MKIYRVIDIELSDVRNTLYDFAIFASGYEKRCIHVPTLLRGGQFRRWVIVGFRELEDDERRRQNDSYFNSHWVGDRIRASGDDEETIYEWLGSNMEDDGTNKRILIDYSSMSRLWYAGVLNWARYCRGRGEVDVDLIYSVGITKISWHRWSLKKCLRYRDVKAVRCLCFDQWPFLDWGLTASQLSAC
jgi:hypothetical protein